MVYSFHSVCLLENDCWTFYSCRIRFVGFMVVTFSELLIMGLIKNYVLSEYACGCITVNYFYSYNAS